MTEKIIHTYYNILDDEEAMTELIKSGISREYIENVIAEIARDYPEEFANQPLKEIK